MRIQVRRVPIGLELRPELRLRSVLMLYRCPTWLDAHVTAPSAATLLTTRATVERKVTARKIPLEARSE